MPDKKQSAFKQLYLDDFRGGDFSKLSESIPKKKITCYVKEAYPHFLIADDFFYVPAYFTQKAIDDFKSKNSSTKITDLQLRVIELSNWTLEVAKVNSADNFTSYGGLELRIVVKEFNINSKQGVSKVKPEDLARYPVNLYRDDEIKSAIQAYTHSQVMSAVKSGVKGDSLPDASKKVSVASGIVKFSNGDKFNSWNFKEGKTATASMDSIAKAERVSGKGKGSVSVKPKVSGGKAKAAAKAAKGGIGSKLAKFTAAEAGKKSKVQKTGTTPKTPGNKASVASVSKLTKSNYASFQKFLKNRKK